MRPAEIENGRIIVINESTVYGGSAEYHCVPLYNRIGPYLRKCMENGLWSGEEPRCERKKIFFVEKFNNSKLIKFLVAVNDAQESGGLGTGIAIGAAIIVILLVLIMLIFLHR